MLRRASWGGGHGDAHLVGNLLSMEQQMSVTESDIKIISVLASGGLPARSVGAEAAFLSAPSPRRCRRSPLPPQSASAPDQIQQIVIGQSRAHFAAVQQVAGEIAFGAMQV